MINKARDEAAGLLDVERGAWANAVGFERLVPAFDFAVGLGIVRRSFDVGETGHADELFEVLGNELGPIVGNDPWLCFGVLFQSALDDDLYVGFGHGLAQLLVDDEARASVEQRAEVVKRPGHVDVRDVHMPVLVGGQWLNEARTFLRRLAVPSLNEPGSLENAVGRRGAHGHNVAVEHHEGEATIALQRELPCELHDRISLPAIDPVVARNP